jgi:hypothetical protein
MSPAQQRLGAAGLNSCSSRFSAIPAALLLLLRHGLKPRLIMALRSAGDGVAAHLQASRPELLMDAWCTVEAAVLIKHCLHLGGDGHVFPGPLARVQLPLPPGIEAAAGHSQLPAEPGRGEAV